MIKRFRTHYRLLTQVISYLVLFLFLFETTFLPAVSYASPWVSSTIRKYPQNVLPDSGLRGSSFPFPVPQGSQDPKSIDPRYIPGNFKNLLKRTIQQQNMLSRYGQGHFASNSDVADLPDIPNTQLELIDSWSGDDGRLFHKIGESAGDGSWVVHSTDGNDYALFGPYITLDPGQYMVEFHLEGENNPNAILDVVTDLGKKTLVKEGISFNGQTAKALTFSIPEKTGNMEFRVYFNGGPVRRLNAEKAVDAAIILARDQIVHSLSEIEMNGCPDCLNRAGFLECVDSHSPELIDEIAAKEETNPEFPELWDAIDTLDNGQLERAIERLRDFTHKRSRRYRVPIILMSPTGRKGSRRLPRQRSSRIWQIHGQGILFQGTGSGMEGRGVDW